MAKYRLVLVRHAESEWNKLNKFCGWYDAPLSVKGEEEAIKTGRLLKENGFVFDLAYTSVLKRAKNTLNKILIEMELTIPVIKNWRLNERMYGGLQGRNKVETVEEYGIDQVMLWRRSYDIRPPPLNKNSPMHPSKDKKYKKLNAKDIPDSECLKDVVGRIVPYFENEIKIKLIEGNSIIVVAHGNSLRALVKYLDNISEEEVVKLNIPTAMPLIYELNEKFVPVRHYYLGDPEKIKLATEAVKNQIKKI